MTRLSSDALLERLRKLSVLDDARAESVRRRLADDPLLLTAEAVREEIGLRGPRFLQLLCEEFGSDFIEPAMLADWPVQPAALERLSSPKAHELAVFPLAWDAGRQRLLLVTAYPFNPHVLGELQEATGVDDIELTFTDEKTLVGLLRRGYIGADDTMGADADEGFEIGAATDEDAFPGIYGGSVSDYLYAEDPEPISGGTAGGEGEGIRGNLADMNFMEILQPLGQNRKTCSVFLTSGNQHAAIYLQDGMVIHAECDDVQGEDAVYRALAWDRGSFEILLRAYPGQPSMMQSVEGLLLEGVRRMDEAAR